VDKALSIAENALKKLAPARISRTGAA